MRDRTCLFKLDENLRTVWEITHKCNYSCGHCCVSSKETVNNELGTQEVKAGLDNLISAGLSSIYFTGGEPLLREDFLDIVNYASCLLNPQNIKFATNGKLVNSEVAKEIANLNLGMVLVSLDGHTPSVAQRFRGIETCYKDAINAVGYIASEKVKVRLGVVIWNGNYKNLEDFIKIGIDQGAEDVFFNWLIPIGKAKVNMDIGVDSSLYFKIADELKTLKERYAEKIKIGYHRFSEINDKDEECFAGEKIIHVLPKGEVSPCSWLYKTDDQFVSKSKVHETSLKSILREKPFERVKKMIKRREEFGVGPGCIALCKAFVGSYLSPDPLHEKNGKWVKEYKNGRCNQR